LIIIDSIAALFRTEFTSGEMASRAKLLTAFGTQLRKLAHVHSVPVVCVNQFRALIHVPSYHMIFAMAFDRFQIPLMWKVLIK
jgi:RecA/RadA recombinase